MAKKRVAKTPGKAANREKTGDATTAAKSAASVLMEPPESGVKVRMYRQGHGDCFLLAFRQDDGSPFYMLIDCGMKKGSTLDRSITEVAENIRDATDNHLHLVVITHEHEDHVSGFLSEKEIFSKMTIDRLWLAWTEDPENDLANTLRQKYHDVLLGLVAASDHLRGIAAIDPTSRRLNETINNLLEFELSDEQRGLAATDPAKVAGRTNKEGILVVKQVADKHKKTSYLRPHTTPQTIDGVSGVRVFVLGPPEVEARLRDMDPQGEEEFHLAATEERSFLAAFRGADEFDDGEMYQPFAAHYRIAFKPPPPGTSPPGDETSDEPPIEARVPDSPQQAFLHRHYLNPRSPEGKDQKWRRIDGDWLRASEQFALRMNNFVNNTSLVLAMELPRTSKVLLFVGDAQRGNWISWHEHDWTIDDGETPGKVTCADLLSRTVFYKVGHHGSHNATLNLGGLKDMAKGAFADEFVAMIPANQKWAEAVKPSPWMHPLQTIYIALLKKARGKVFVMDRDLGRDVDRKLVSPSDWLPDGQWASFEKSATSNPLFFEMTIEDETA